MTQTAAHKRVICSSILYVPTVAVSIHTMDAELQVVYVSAGGVASAVGPTPLLQKSASTSLSTAQQSGQQACTSPCWPSPTRLTGSGTPSEPGPSESTAMACCRACSFPTRSLAAANSNATVPYRMWTARQRQHRLTCHQRYPHASSNSSRGRARG